MSGTDLADSLRPGGNSASDAGPKAVGCAVQVQRLLGQIKTHFPTISVQPAPEIRCLAFDFAACLAIPSTRRMLPSAYAARSTGTPPKSNARNGIFRTICTRNAVSCL
eukprot:446413-Rhodomonas_salina.1